MFESTGVLKTALWRPTVFLELQSSGTTSRLSPKIGPVIGLSVAVGCQLSGGPENHPGERDHFASESEMSPQIGLNGAVGGPRSGGLPEAPEEVVGLNKTKTRNSLALDGTLSSIMTIKMADLEPCFKWEPPSDVLKASKKATGQYNRAHRS
ncbi:unnamed protein product [Boreogadus saida]